MISITTKPNQKNKSKARAAAGKILAAAFWLAVWELAFLCVRQEILIASPVEVLQKLFQLAQGLPFWESVLHSMFSIVGGFLLGLAAGTLLAVLTCAVPLLYDLFYPIISIMKAAPVASFIILALVWIPSARVPIFTSFLMVLPIIWGNVAGGIAATDRSLLQMAQAYRFGTLKTLRLVYFPSVLPYFVTACTAGLGLAWKSGVAAEVLANTDFSIGGQIYNSKIYLETDSLFAWTAIVILLSVILEHLLVVVMKKAEARFRGRKEGSNP